LLRSIQLENGVASLDPIEERRRFARLSRLKNGVASLALAV
jgi:hypothetical protein